MRLLICIDDTDTLDSKGTGSIAEELRTLIESGGFGKCGFITRHQLLLHEDIPYTSHNSSMCFECDIDGARYDELLPKLFSYLQKESAAGSDPGLAVAKLDDKPDAEALWRFGMDAKRVVLDKETAYEAAARQGIYLREAGGTGQGVIGALAGIGLRLSGNDGDVKGAPVRFDKGGTYAAAEIMRTPYLEMICDEDMREIPPDDKVLISWKAKLTLIRGKVSLIVIPTDTPQVWQTMKKEDMRKLSNERVYREGCENFSPDVEEEQVLNKERSCFNCRYRRWTEDGLVCVYANNAAAAKA